VLGFELSTTEVLQFAAELHLMAGRALESGRRPKNLTLPGFSNRTRVFPGGYVHDLG